MMLLSWLGRTALGLAATLLIGCGGTSNQPRGSSPPSPSAQEKATLKSDPSEKVGAPLSKKTAKGR
ncbi:MAG: hypothetical protein U0790_04315 [Isosphaeraceae bacterium]